MTQVNQQRFDKRSPRRKVLLVSENVHELRHQARLCAAEDFNVLRCDSYEAAMHFIAHEAFDLVVADQGFAALKAHDMLRHLNRCSPSTPFVLLTSRNDLACYLRAFARTWRAAACPPSNSLQPSAWRDSVALRNETRSPELPG